MFCDFEEEYGPLTEQQRTHAKIIYNAGKTHGLDYAKTGKTRPNPYTRRLLDVQAWDAGISAAFDDIQKVFENVESG